MKSITYGIWYYVYNTLFLEHIPPSFMIPNLPKNTPLKSSVKKICVSIKLHHWQRLQEAKNKSFIINQALSLFFDKQDYLESVEEARVAQQIGENTDMSS